LLGGGERNRKCNSSINGNLTTVRCKLKPEDLAVIESILSCSSLEDKTIDGKWSHSDQAAQHQTLIKMIDAAVDSVRKDPLNKRNEPHLTLMAHSLSASVVAAAISAWKQHQIQERQVPTRRVEDLLHQALTVVTLGNVCRTFCDGPAYIHISMYDDPWSDALGSSSSSTNDDDECGGGRDAVYFHGCSPYYESDSTMDSLKSHNAHSLNACLIQYLCLIMRINGIRSLRALYDAARFVDPTIKMDISPQNFAVSCNHGDLVIPPHIDDELLPSMIRATGGDRWVWKTDNGDDDEDEVESFLPDEFEASSHLGYTFGYSVFEDIYETCCSGTPARSID